MLQVSKQQSLDRWDALPENLREALVSEQNSMIVDRICEPEHISNDKLRAVNRIAGWVLMGFLHPEEAKKEIQDAIQLDPQHAEKIANDLNSRLFSTFRADLDKIYAPPGAAVPRAAAIPAAPPPFSPIPPKPMEEIRKPETGIKPSSEFELKAAKFFGAQAPSVPKPPAPAGPPRPPSPAAPPAPAPAPFMMRKEMEMKPLTSAAPHLELTGERGGRGGAAPGIPNPRSPAPPPLPAHLEIGKELPQAPKAEAVARTEITPPKVVHYSDMKTPLPPTRTAEGVVPVPLTEFGRVAPSPPRPSGPAVAQAPVPPVGARGPLPPPPPAGTSKPIPTPPPPPQPPAPPIK